MPEKTALITGGTGALGRHTAGLLADAGWSVIVTGRNPAALAEATDVGLIGKTLDLGSLRAVREFAASLPKLDAVICNAGIQTPSGTKRTEDGYEQTFAVNHLAHFLLVHELLPGLANARVMFVASDTHDPRNRTGMPAPEYTGARSLAEGEDDGNGRRRYTTSKLCNVLATYEFARRAPEGVTFNAFDPGLMPGTGLAREYPGALALVWRYLLPALIVVPGVNAHTPRRSAQALARLVLDPALAGVNGKYFSGLREIPSSRDSYDREKAADLWDGSLELIKT
ncbi:SDR family NAD(P)-dependent oxidoreductase [Amycolatopsis acidicola]|uniref:SDR family NAD(P)-dependent oxidoreductase n=1 Tax=Amycolatopsis acidicola TaxID=2596893 RepID=A0A5N0VJE9_9PSEU|nr:SDR family NAD(P)-dependent oxidoreductase [Amycolatopsis acidicola]KAA9165603.1 SDR family NAD(P)-dependent oxidoreductase [Amycolatopsis acidicola]